MICSTISLSRYHDNSLRFNWFILRLHQQRTNFFAKLFAICKFCKIFKKIVLFTVSLICKVEKSRWKSSAEFGVNYFIFLKLLYLLLPYSSLDHKSYLFYDRVNQKKS